MDRREALAEDLRALADDLRTLIQDATSDPQSRKRKERQWAALYGAMGIVTSMVARRFAVRIWGILTGEAAPKTVSSSSPPSSKPTREEERSPARPAA